MHERTLDLDVTRVFRVLALDDQDSTLEQIDGQLDPLGIEVIKAKTAAEAIDILDQRYIDAAIVDLDLDGVEAGREVLRVMRHRAPAAATVIATAYTDDLGEFIGVEAPKLMKIVTKRQRMPSDWAAKATRKPFEKWKASAVKINNLELVMELLGDRSARIPGLRKGEELACELDRLFRCLFGVASAPSLHSSAISVDLRPIRSEGLSPAVTVEATVGFRHDHAEGPVPGTPVVLKIASCKSTETEADCYHRFVKYGVPLLHRVEMLGHSEDRVLGACCYSFAGRDSTKALESFDEQLCVREKQALVRQVLDSLFDEPAKSWYDVKADRVSPMAYVTKAYSVDLVKCQEKFSHAAEAVAKRAGDEVEFTAPEARADGELRAGRTRLSIPRLSTWGDGVFHNGTECCLVHGDMHGGNVMLELNDQGLERVCLIDYANAGPGPRLVDFAAMEASVRLRDARSILAEFGVDHERELDDDSYRKAIMRAAGRVEAERQLMEAVWDISSTTAPPNDEWALPVMQLSLLAHTNFKEDLEEREYLAVAVPCAMRHFLLHVNNLTRVRFAAWISAVYERYRGLNAQ
jgi:CheY-like chemotaxis protein